MTESKPTALDPPPVLLYHLYCQVSASPGEGLIGLLGNSPSMGQVSPWKL